MIVMRVGHANLLILENSRSRLVLIEALQLQFWSQNHPSQMLKAILFKTYLSISQPGQGGFLLTITS